MYRETHKSKCFDSKDVGSTYLWNGGNIIHNCMVKRPKNRINTKTDECLNFYKLCKTEQNLCYLKDLYWNHLVTRTCKRKYMQHTKSSKLSTSNFSKNKTKKQTQFDHAIHSQFSHGIMHLFLSYETVKFLQRINYTISWSKIRVVKQHSPYITQKQLLCVEVQQ